MLTQCTLYTLSIATGSITMPCATSRVSEVPMMTVPLDSVSSSTRTNSFHCIRTCLVGSRCREKATHDSGDVGHAVLLRLPVRGEQLVDGLRRCVAGRDVQWIQTGQPGGQDDDEVGRIWTGSLLIFHTLGHDKRLLSGCARPIQIVLRACCNCLDVPSSFGVLPRKTTLGTR